LIPVFLRFAMKNHSYIRQHWVTLLTICTLQSIWFSADVLAQINLLTFSKNHGYYYEPFTLELQTPVPDARIYYTTDGSSPSASNGILYSQEILINKTTILRAIVTSPNASFNMIFTRSYLFPEDIIRQPNNLPGYPANWGPYTAISGIAKADYEMDPELMKNPAFALKVQQALQQLPVVSIVTPISNLFSTSTDPEAGGILIYTGAPVTNFTYTTGRGWERPASVEFIGVGNESFQVDCGLRVQGGHSRRPEKSPKRSFLLNFDSMYGPDKISLPLLGTSYKPTYKKLILRASFGNSWIHQEHSQRSKATYLEDIWTKDSQRAMGHPASNSIYAHLFLNGMYWGIYGISERMDKDFGESYLWGDDNDFDVIKDYTEVANGDIIAWDKMMAMANAGLETHAKYMQIQGKNEDGTDNPAIEPLVDVVNLADYMLLNFYGANSDWDHHNWAAMRNRVSPGKGFTFMCWDAEMMFSNLNGNILNENNANCPSRVYQQLIKNAAFKHLLADRIQKHLFNDGALTPDSVRARWLRRKATLEEVIHAESARWGDYRRDVHSWSTSGPFDLYGKDNYWTPQNNYLLNTFFPQRTGIFLTQLRAAGLFPSINAPNFLINNQLNFNGKLKRGDKLSLTVSQGSIFYTDDGTDPLNTATGLLSSKAKLYNQAITLNRSANIIARTLHNNTWSAAHKRFYLIPEELSDIKITEIHYQPSDGEVSGSEYEFIELKNTGQSTFNLGGFQFNKGITYFFPPDTPFRPGEFIVLASNSRYFSARYGFNPAGEYRGQLENQGEEIEFQNASGETLISFAYRKDGLWPANASGKGFSLAAAEENPTGHPSNPGYWKVSRNTGGSPGADDLTDTAIPVLQVHTQLTATSFPIPFTSIVHIECFLPCDGKLNLTIYDLTGKQIVNLAKQYRNKGKHTFTLDEALLNTTALQEGVYFCRISLQGSDANYQSVVKLVKVRE